MAKAAGKKSGGGAGRGGNRKTPTKLKPRRSKSGKLKSQAKK